MMDHQETDKSVITKDDKLNLLTLLSAVESWSFSVKEHFPDHLHENLLSAVDTLRKEVLK
jgi:hypothetical protein